MAKRTQLVGRFLAPPDSPDFFTSGCQILDCVMGGGYPERRVTNIVGDKCLSGDTIISAKRGASRPRKMTMKTLFNRVKGGHWNRNDTSETFLVADVGGYAGLSKMLDVVYSGHKVLYEIINDRGDIIRASEDHKFATVDGWDCLSEGLTIGTQVKCWRGTRDRGREGVREGSARIARPYTYSVPFHPFGQRNMVAGRDYKRLPTARLVIEAEINGMSVQEFVQVLRKDPATAATLQYTSPKLEVHHLDGNPINDSLDNLQLVSPEEHWGIHAAEMPRDTKPIGVSEIVSIERVGLRPTYDITMEDPHNFVANNYVVHNSTGKTLLATEAMINFARKHEDGEVYYIEVESAFDLSYAQNLGLDPDRVQVVEDKDTVEDVFEFLSELTDGQLAEGQQPVPTLVIVDSLDALSDRAELERKIDESTYSANKPKQLSALFRRLVRKLRTSHVTLIVISQIRDKLGVTFGKKYSRSGGKALDFYASVVLYLAEVGKRYKTVSGVKRPIGADIRVKCEKNKVGLPFRECDVPMLFGYGIEDAEANLNYLAMVGALKDVNDALQKAKLRPIPAKPTIATYSALMSDSKAKGIIARVTRQVWDEVETEFVPKVGKYGG